MEDALDEIGSMRRLLEKHQLTAQMMNVINDVLTAKACCSRPGTVQGRVPQ
ncbi:MAG: hypothetical protein IPG66_13375 [Hydrogenophilales bacterium]|nr:hypothetical protein [Hydrogenophilales bacterium]